VNQAIGRELHGIDSDALLNSCLVEQKELGKLESVSRQDRIRAVTSLLNLEAFVDAQQELDRSQTGLDRAGLILMGADAVQYSVAGLMGHDVVGEACIDGVLLFAEVIELKALAPPVVESVLHHSGMGHDDEPVSIETPGDGPPRAR
jgi:hypothetical protein